MELTRHRGKCSVCKHPEIKEIESKFLSWESRPQIEQEFGLPSTSLHRYATAMGLYGKRQHNLSDALDKVIERGLATMPNITATNVIEAIKMQAKLTGQWVDRTQELPPGYCQVKSIVGS